MALSALNQSIFFLCGIYAQALGKPLTKCPSACTHLILKRLFSKKCLGGGLPGEEFAQAQRAGGVSAFEPMAPAGTAPGPDSNAEQGWPLGSCSFRTRRNIPVLRVLQNLAPSPASPRDGPVWLHSHGMMTDPRNFALDTNTDPESRS